MPGPLELTFGGVRAILATLALRDFQLVSAPPLNLMQAYLSRSGPISLRNEYGLGQAGIGTENFGISPIVF